MEPDALVRYEITGQVAVLTVNRPKVLNALSRATIAALLETLQRAEDDDAVRAVILTGAGDRAFVAGADITELQRASSANEVRLLAEYGHGVGRLIARMRKVVIAAVNGFALGGGCELAMSCDIRIAADTARFGQPEVNLGVLPGWGGTQRLTRLVGPGMSKLLNLTGEQIDAETALRIGLVERVVPAAELMDAAHALASQIASKAPQAVAAIKQAINRGADMSLDDANSYESALFGAIVTTDDGREGTTAFVEKRKPTWQGS